MTLLLRSMEMSERGCFIFLEVSKTDEIFRIWSLIETGRLFWVVPMMQIFKSTLMIALAVQSN